MTTSAATPAASAPGVPAAPLSPGLVTLGETMGLISQSTPGALSHHRAMLLTVGGAETNVAIAVRRLGGRATWFGRVGRDEIGDVLLRELAAEGVDARVVRDEAPTGLMIKTRRTAEASRVIYYRADSAGAHLNPDDLDEATIRAAQVLHVTGITPALSTSARDAVEAAMEIAQGAAVPISFDVNYRSALWDDRTAGRVFREMASRADIVFAGDDEARLITDGGDPHELADGIAALGPTQAIIKLGARGCVASIDGSRYTQPTVAVQAVDTVGAGDAFVGGYLTELMAGADARQRLGTAVAAGAFAVTTIGDWEGLPTRAELALLTAPDPVIR